jgi:hypothetical protein
MVGVVAVLVGLGAAFCVSGSPVPQGAFVVGDQWEQG